MQNNMRKTLALIKKALIKKKCPKPCQQFKIDDENVTDSKVMAEKFHKDLLNNGLDLAKNIWASSSTFQFYLNLPKEKFNLSD